MPWTRTPITELLGTRYPLIQAPMARISTPGVAAAVSEAGALGSIAGAPLSPSALREAIAAVRLRTERPFAVNLFAPLEPPSDAGVEAMAEFLSPWRARVGLPPEPAPRGPAPEFADQIAVVIEARPAAFSFTFGIPPADALDAVREAGIAILGTATTAGEAEALERAGVDAVVAQGAEAGGHPVVAAGGIMDGRGIVAALALGAGGAQLGTAFIGVTESGAPPAYVESLLEADETATTVTRAFTGRHARALRTPFLDELEAAGLEVPAYPLQQSLMMELFAAGLERGVLDPVLRLAGQGAPAIRELPAAELVEAVVAETDEAIARFPLA
jgi:nitronate monooxygenase